MSPQSVPVSRLATSNSELNDFGRLMEDARRRYEEKTGKDLLKHPIAKDFPSSVDNAGDIMKYFESKTESFKAYRAGGEKIRGVLKPIMDVILLLRKSAEGASDGVPSGDTIFGAIGVLLQTAKGVSALYDEIGSLFDEIKRYFDRVSIHLPKVSTSGNPPVPALMNILVDMLVEVLGVLAIATKYCNIAAKREKPLKKAMSVLSRRTKDYLLVLTDQNDVKDALAKLERLADQEEQIAVAAIYASVREDHPRMKYVYDETVAKSLRSWLRAPNPQPINYERKRQAGSCQWFFNDQFEDWKSRKDGLYWVYGRAGTGKSVLCSSVIDTLKKDTTLLLAYFYFDVNDPEKQDCHGLVSSLVFQIGTSFEEGISYLRTQRRSSDSPVYEELLAMLSQLLDLSGRTAIVIDALDECPEPARDSSLLDFLEHLSKIQSGGNVNSRVLVASRLEPDIQNCMPRLSTHVLDFGDASQHMDEIRDHIVTQLHGQGAASYLGWSDATKRDVEWTLMWRSNGIFLWVKLQLQALKRCTTQYDVERALNELPSGLNETYERILTSFQAPNTAVDRVRRVFECVAFAARSLSPTEVTEILFMNFDSPAELPISLNSDSIDTVDPDTFILQKCPGLLEVVFDLEGRKIVQFIHLSVKEYLVSDKLQQSAPVRLYQVREGAANLTLARICLSALDVDSKLLNLRQYADEHWHRHVSDDIGNFIGELLFRFLHLGSEAYARWSVTDVKFGEPSRGSALHCAASLNLCCHTKRILEHPQSSLFAPGTPVPRVRDADGATALHIAATYGFIEVAHILLTHGALAEDVDDKGKLPIHRAAWQGHSSVVRLLLESPAPDGSSTAASQCSARDHKGKTVLHHATEYGCDVESCQLLIRYGALVDATDNRGKTPLHDAAIWRQEDIVRLLLEHPAVDGSDMSTFRVRARDDNGRNALHWAASSPARSVEKCRILLEHGALIDDVDNDGDTPLHIAARERYNEGVVRLLLEYSATDDPNASATSRCHTRNQRGETVLHCAAMSGSSGVYDLLLEHGAVIDDSNIDGDTPIHCAARYGRHEAIKTLLLHPAADGSNVARLRCQARNLRGETALHLAASCQYLGADETYKELLEHGALIDDTDHNGDTPLHHASSTGRLKTVRFLLRYPAMDGSGIATFRCRARNQNGRTALHEAASRGRVEVCSTLLRYGALVAATDANGDTALSLAQARIEDRTGHDFFFFFFFFVLKEPRR